MFSTTIPPLAVYKKGSRTFLRMKHGKNDIVIDNEVVPRPFRDLLNIYGNAIVYPMFKRPEDLTPYEWTPPVGKKKEEPKSKKKTTFNVAPTMDTFGHWSSSTFNVQAMDKIYRMTIGEDENKIMDVNGRKYTRNPAIHALLKYHPSETINLKKHIGIMFRSHLRYIRQKIDGANYGEGNPDLSHDPENGGRPEGTIYI